MRGTKESIELIGNHPERRRRKEERQYDELGWTAV
jgi:hypothetical protein